MKPKLNTQFPQILQKRKSHSLVLSSYYFIRFGSNSREISLSPEEALFCHFYNTDHPGSRHDNKAEGNRFVWNNEV